MDLVCWLETKRLGQKTQLRFFELWMSSNSFIQNLIRSSEIFTVRL
jgi:hypothetical protein